MSPEKDEGDRTAVQPFQSPKIHIGHGTGVIEAMPTIVRFWNQLNVTPLNGPKDVHAVALLSDSGGNAQLRQAEIWLDRLGKEYTVKRFGMHTVAPQLQKNPRGIDSIRWDNFRVVCGMSFQYCAASSFAHYRFIRSFGRGCQRFITATHRLCDSAQYFCQSFPPIGGSCPQHHVRH